MSTLSRIAVLGAGGQVGRALLSTLKERAIGLSRTEADLAEPGTVLKALERIAPDAVINAAAYTQVDKAESETSLAQKVNAYASGKIAEWCAEKQIPLVYYSTDYVFDGVGEIPWEEIDPTAPLNTYGKTKLAGERAIEAVAGNYLIFRTSWVYDAEGGNFLNTMLRLGAERESLRIVADQHGAPTYAPHLAQATVKALDRAIGMEVFPRGIYHAANAGETTWYGFAQAIFAQAREEGMQLAIKTVEPIPSVAYPTPAVRPLNSRLNCQRLHNVFGVSLPQWEQGLAEAMEKKRASHHLSD